MADRAQPGRGASRRHIIAGAGRLTIGAAALGIVAGCTTMAAVEPKRAAGAGRDDVALLNNVLGLEYEAVAAYDAALAGGALAGKMAALARAFQDDHAKHAAALARAVTRLQGKPVGPRPAVDYSFSPAGLTSGEDAMRFLLGFEQGLALAHLGAVPAFADNQLAKGAAGILGIEAMHWSSLRSALGETPVPAPFLG
jgi:hypothetical protein